VGNLPPGIENISLQFVVDDGNGGEAIERLMFSIPPAPVLAPALPEPEAEEITEPEIEITEAPQAVLPTTPEPIEKITPDVEPEPEAEVELDIDRDIETPINRVDVDLASLIQPLEQIKLIDLTTTDNTIESINKPIDLQQIEPLELSNLWINLEEAFNQPSDIEFEDLASEFDRQREEMAEQIASKQTLIGSSFTISSGLSVGYLLWLIRGGTLMGSVLSSLPAWRLVDPLPVLSSLGDDFGEDDESLETMVENEHPDDESPASKDQQPDT